MSETTTELRATECVETLVRRNACLQAVILHYPDVLLILKTAALYPNGNGRWHMYSELKRRLYACPVAPHEYEAVIAAIDALLPDEGVGLVTGRYLEAE